MLFRSDLETLLRKIGDGSSPEAALRLTLHTSYSGMEESIGQFLQTKYGR